MVPCTHIVRFQWMHLSRRPPAPRTVPTCDILRALLTPRYREMFYVLMLISRVGLSSTRLTRISAHDSELVFVLRAHIPYRCHPRAPFSSFSVFLLSARWQAQCIAVIIVCVFVSAQSHSLRVICGARLCAHKRAHFMRKSTARPQPNRITMIFPNNYSNCIRDAFVIVCVYGTARLLTLVNIVCVVRLSMILCVCKCVRCSRAARSSTSASLYSMYVCSRVANGVFSRTERNVTYPPARSMWSNTFRYV